MIYFKTQSCFIGNARTSKITKMFKVRFSTDFYWHTIHNYIMLAQRGDNLKLDIILISLLINANKEKLTVEYEWVYNALLRSLYDHKTLIKLAFYIFIMSDWKSISYSDGSNKFRYFQSKTVLSEMTRFVKT